MPRCHRPLVQSVFVRTFRICSVVTALAVIAAYAHRLCLGAGTPASGRFASSASCAVLDLGADAGLRLGGAAVERGLINTWLQAAGVIAEPLTLVRNEFGVVVA